MKSDSLQEDLEFKWLKIGDFGLARREISEKHINQISQFQNKTTPGPTLDACGTLCRFSSLVRRWDRELKKPITPSPSPSSSPSSSSFPSSVTGTGVGGRSSGSRAVERESAVLSSEAGDEAGGFGFAWRSRSRPSSRSAPRTGLALRERGGGRSLRTAARFCSRDLEGL